VSIVSTAVDSCTTCADAVRFVYSGPSEPFVIIAEPKSYSLQEYADLTVKATAGNLEADWGIKFILDSDEANYIIDKIQPFEVVFSDLALGEHVIDAYVVNEFDVEVTGATTHDTVENVGIGDYYGAVGDSITYGSDDVEPPFDNSSSDGRNTGGEVDTLPF